MPAVNYKNFEQILQQLINSVVAQTDLSDVTDSSTMKHFLAAFAREADEIYFQLGLTQEKFNLDTAVGDDLDERVAEVSAGIIVRRTSKQATGEVQFGRTGTVGAVNIPAGTIVKTSDGVEFETTAIGTIPDGFSVSGDVPVIAVVGGEDGNRASGTINRFGSKPAGVETVTNADPTQFGEDEESDDSLRTRAREWQSGLARCHPSGLETAAKNVQLANGQRVEYAHVVEDIDDRGEVTLYIDDGQGTAETFVEVTVPEVVIASAVGGEEFLSLDFKPTRRAGPTALVVTSSVNGVLTEGVDYTFNEANSQIGFNSPLVAAEQITAVYTYFTGLIAEVQKVIDGDENDRANYEGYRAAGVRVIVTTPTILIQQVEASLVLAEGFALADIEADVQQAVIDYVNGLGISGDVLRNRIIEAIMGVDGVSNCSVSNPAADVVVLDDQLPRTTTNNIILS